MERDYLEQILRWERGWQGRGSVCLEYRMEEEDGKRFRLELQAGCFPAGFCRALFFLSFLRGGACFSMVIQPFKSMGRGITCLFKFVYLEDLSGLMWGIGNR